MGVNTSLRCYHFRNAFTYFPIGEKYLQNYTQVFGIRYFHFGIIRFVELNNHEIKLLLCTVLANKELNDMLTSVLLFYHNESIKMSCLICMVCDFASHQPRDITIGISIIGYSVPRHISWFNNYKLHYLSNSFPALLLVVAKQFQFWLNWINC